MHDLPISTIVNFVILVVGLVFLLRKHLRTALFERHETIKKAVAEAEELRTSVERMVKDYESKLSNLDAEIAQILKEAREAGEAERRRILERAKLSAERIKQDAQRSIEMEIAKARHELEREVMEKAAAHAETLLREKFSEKDHQRFMNEFIAHLEGTDGQRL